MKKKLLLEKELFWKLNINKRRETTTGTGGLYVDHYKNSLSLVNTILNYTVRGKSIPRNQFKESVPMHEDKKNQQKEIVSDKKSSNEKLGGFMASIHEVEETIYGPESPLDGKTKVFLCIRHKIIRDWKRVKAISKNEIIRATGITNRRHFDRTLKALEKDKMIISQKSKTGLKWNTTLYALHPHRFPKTLWEGGQKEIELSNKNQTHEVSHDAEIIPISRKKGSAQQALASEKGSATEALSGSAPQTPQNELNFSELLEKIDSKNPLKKKKNLKNPGELEELNTLSGKRDPKEMRLWIDETNGREDFEEWRKRRA